jgi:hypothetical protein
MPRKTTLLTDSRLEPMIVSESVGRARKYLTSSLDTWVAERTELTSQSPLRDVVDHLPYGISRRKLATGTTTKVDLLQLEEFVNLATLIVERRSKPAVGWRTSRDRWSQTLRSIRRRSPHGSPRPHVPASAEEIADRRRSSSLLVAYNEQFGITSNKLR